MWTSNSGPPFNQPSKSSTKWAFVRYRPGAVGGGGGSHRLPHDRHSMAAGVVEKSVSTGTTAITGVAGGRSGSSTPAAIECLSCGSLWLPPPPPTAPGLYLTKAHFVDDFEGWLKGGPEFEVHILGQKGQTDSLTDYQCAGEKQPAPYYFDQNALDWSGSVMLFSKVQVDAYNAAHPGQNIRVFVVEDDDTACQIKADRNLLNDAIKAVDGAYKAITAGNDSSSSAQRTFKRASAFQKLWAALASLINTNDELVGNAVEDVVVGISYPGYNWIVKGQNNATNGWITLGMK